ncbi:MAG TPA: transglycosylase domain-containing protein, partial [Nocardioides sp.]|nr:transglycosylase domain-containing protein [Nocardioides sp.]
MSGKRRAAGPASKTTGASKAAKPPRTRKQKVLRVAKWTGLVGLVGLLLASVGFVVLYQSIDIPDPNKDFQTETSFVYYSNGKDEVGTFAEQNRIPVSLDDIPQTMQDAVVAAENRSFWSDSGLDFKGIIRAALNNASSDNTQGASTITQQYVKILYLSQERTYTRKVKEAILSLKLQREMSKSEILHGYLNTIYFGRGAYGVQAAAEAFFAKDVGDLSLRESAVLACVINNPSRFDPANGKEAREALKGRYAYVLDGMAKAENITAEEAEKAAKRLPKFPEIKAESRYAGQRGHVLAMVRKELTRLPNNATGETFTDDEIDGGGLRVTTTFTKKAMDAAEEGVKASRPDLSDKALHVGVASVEPGTGAVRGIFGGQDFLQSQINWAVAGGQAGSILKPFALVAAIRDGFSLKDSFDGDSPYVLPDGTDVENQGNESFGPVSMIDATKHSINTAFIDMTLGMDGGPDKILTAMNEMGLPPEKAKSAGSTGFPNRTPGLIPTTGIALGSATVSPINMANAYATLAAGGEAAEPFIIDKVTDADGTVLYRHKVQSEQVVTPDGTGYRAMDLDRPAAGKTGTSTNDDGDVVSSWFTGFTPQLATSVVYVRGKGAEPLDGFLEPFYGGTYPAGTWTQVMLRAM